MKRQLKKEELGKLYKEFSRQKYNKYKHQYPRMRESQLVNKIIKEWEALSKQEKHQLYQTYSDNQEIPEGSDSSDKKESPGSSKEKRKNSRSLATKQMSSLPSSQKTPNKKSNVRVFNRSSSSKKEKDQSVESDFERDGVKKDFQISQSDSDQVRRRAALKKKRITKETQAPMTQYLKFYKFYYDKLSSQHPKWAANQITTIIKLLWKKKLSQQKKQKKLKATPPRQRKPISGRMTFRKSHGYDKDLAFIEWYKQPKESQKYWKRKGKGLLSDERNPIEPSITFRSTRRGSRKGSGDSESVAQKFSFLLKQMPF